MTLSIPKKLIVLGKSGVVVVPPGGGGPESIITLGIGADGDIGVMLLSGIYPAGVGAMMLPAEGEGIPVVSLFGWRVPAYDPDWFWGAGEVIWNRVVVPVSEYVRRE